MYLGLLTTSCLLSALLLGVDGHGAIIGISGSAKGSRNFQAHRGQIPGLREYDPYSLNGLNGRVDETNSPCGEPGQTQHGEQYKSMEDKWIIKTAAGQDWSSRQEIEFELRVTANHGGTMEYRWMCGDGKATTEIEDFYDEVNVQPESACYGNYPTATYRNGKCLLPRLLERVHKGETLNYWPSEPNQYILSQDSQCQENNVGGVFKMTYKLPATQCSRIVIQWWWNTANSCIPPAWKAARNIDFPCKSGNWPNYGLKECNGMSGTAWGSGEQFANCLDLVLGDSPAPSPKPPAPSPPATSPPALPSPVPSPVPSPNPQPSPVPPPSGNGVQRKVIYLGWDLVSFNDLISDLQAVVNSGYNVINLAFWLIRADGSTWVADSAGVWQGMSTAQKQASLDLVHNAGGHLMVSCGGATMDLELVMESYMTGTQFGQACAQFAADNMLDGVDFDLETHPGNSAPFRDGSLITWAVDATRAARAVLGSKALISHAPQSPYAGTWAGAQKGYVEIMRLAGSEINFLNMQYYNQGAGVYNTYEQTFIASSGWWSETSVMEMARNGIALNKIVIGKYFAGDGGSGYISAATMAQWASRAQTELGWTAGIMNWVHKHSQSDRTRAWGAAIPLGSTTPTEPSPVPSPQPPTEPSPVPSPSPQPPTEPSPVPSPQPPKPSPVPSPQPPTEPSPVPSPQPPAASPAPSAFEVTLRQSTEWAGSVRITPYGDVQKAYLMHPGGETQLRPDAAGEMFPVFYWSVRVRPADQPSCQIKIVDQSGAATSVPLNWGTRRSMQTLSVEEPTATPESSKFQGATAMTVLFGVVGVLLLARRHRQQAVQFESLKDIQISLE